MSAFRPGWLSPATRLAFALLITLAAAGARAEIEFVGLLITSQTARFALSDTATGRHDWVARGDAFGDYTVGDFDPREDTLTLKRDGADRRIRLKDDAKIKAARLELTGEITFGATEKIAVERATLLFDQENVFPLKDGLTYRITPTRRPDNTIHYRIAVERALAENKTETLAAPSVIVLPGHSFKVRFSDELAFSFTPR